MTNQQPTPHRWAEVIKAWADGKTVQYRDDVDEQWFDHNIHHPEWYDYRPLAWTDDRGEWRIKPERKTGWINIYHPPFSAAIRTGVHVHADKASADREAPGSRIACIQISWTEGEGL